MTMVGGVNKLLLLHDGLDALLLTCDAAVVLVVVVVVLLLLLHRVYARGMQRHGSGRCCVD